MSIKTAGVLAGLLLLCASASSQSEADSIRLFEEKIAPLLSARCGKCHGTDAPKAKGGLRIDSR